MLSRISSVLMHVSNLRISVDFYTNRLGFEETLSSRRHRSLQPASSTFDEVEIDIGGGVELCLMEVPLLAEMRGSTALNFTVQNLDGFRTEIRAQGVKYDYNPPLNGHPSTATVFCDDPDGNTLTFSESPS